MASRNKIIPLIVAAPMFLQNVDMLATTVALPDMAASLNVLPLQLNMVVAAYAIGLAVFLPLSAWMVERFGAKRIFCTAIVIFASASALCGIANSAGVLIGCRVFQGFGAAMMVPVGRLILLRSVSSSDLLVAMVWFTIPPAIGRFLGPLIGGAIVSITSWRWIFWVNVPLGALAVVLALALLEKDDPSELRKSGFDGLGFLLIGVGLGATLGGIEAAGRGLVGSWTSYGLVTVGISSIALYVMHSLRSASPVIDLGILRYKTFRTNVLGAAPLRLTTAAAPFLVPLMLQLGYGMSPLRAGLMSSGVAAGSIGTRVILKRTMSKLSFRSLFLLANLLTALLYCAYGLLTSHLPDWLLFTTFFLGGLVTSLCLVSLNTVGFVDVPTDRTAHATAMLAMAQQVTSAVGVVIAASLLGAFSSLRGGPGTHLAASDFTATFFVMALLATFSLFPFARLDPEEGSALR